MPDPDIQAVIYDCDGVLFDSLQANIKLYNHILGRFEKPHMTEADIEFIHMSTAKGAISYLFKDDPNLDEALAYWPKLDYSPFLDYLIVEPHLEDILE
ncbi:MAG: HAD hydrolase-like protein, partial [Desulfatiglandales bacterium]